MQIFIALILAIVVGLLMQSHAEFAESYIKPFGTIFLNLVKFIVVPIVLFSIMCGIISMQDIKKVGAIGLKTVVYYMCTTAFAITFGLIGGNLFKGMFPVVATTDLTYEAAESVSFMDTIVNIFPSNFIAPMSESNMLQVIVMSVLFGFAIILIGPEKNPRLIQGCNDLNDMFMIISNRSILSVVPGYCSKWSDDHRFTGNGAFSSVCLLHYTCSCCIFISSKDNGRYESDRIL